MDPTSQLQLLTGNPASPVSFQFSKGERRDWETKSTNHNFGGGLFEDTTSFFFHTAEGINPRHMLFERDFFLGLLRGPQTKQKPTPTPPLHSTAPSSEERDLRRLDRPPSILCAIKPRPALGEPTRPDSRGLARTRRAAAAGFGECFGPCWRGSAFFCLFFSPYGARVWSFL